MEPQPTMPPSFDGVLKTQYEQIGTNFRTVWDIYIKYYTVFITLNFTALGITIQYIGTEHRLTLVVSFTIQNIFSTITALGVSAYSSYAAKQQKAIIDEVSQHLRLEDKARLPYETTIPVKLTYWAGIANGLGHFLFIACWVAVYQMGK